MWHVTPGTRYLGQYMCVATNSVTTTETVHNFTGETIYKNIQHEAD